MNKGLRYFIINSLILAGSLLLTLNAVAEPPAIINVRRNIPLSNDEEVYKDYYISGGAAAGLKKNLVINIVRKMQIRDASGANSFGEVPIPVGKVRIIAVYPTLAIARDYLTPERFDLPMLEMPWVMVGDYLDFEGSFLDSKYKRPLKPTALKESATQSSNPLLLHSLQLQSPLSKEPLPKNSDPGTMISAVDTNNPASLTSPPKTSAQTSNTKGVEKQTGLTPKVMESETETPNDSPTQQNAGSRIPTPQTSEKTSHLEESSKIPDSPTAPIIESEAI